MMKDIFLSIADMSITAAFVIPVILLVRLLLKGAPKKYSYFIWAVVAFRLCCPVSISSRFSIFNLFEKEQAAAPAINNQIYTATAPATVEKEITTTDILAMIWIAGALILLIYAVINYTVISKRVAAATKDSEDVFCVEGISTPFILGFISPKIYIPYGLDENTRHYVLTHERYHLKRFDHIVKPLAFFILTLHWFNPLCWLSYILMSRDMELSCDEKVLSEGVGLKKYSSALLSFAVNKRFPAPAPLAFGEVSIKARIKNILGWKKPALWITVIAVVVCVVSVTVCVSNAEKISETDEKDQDSAIAETEWGDISEKEAFIPETEAPEPEHAETEAPETVPAETEEPEPEPAETEAPEPEPAETQAPRPEPAETQAPRPEPAETQAPRPEPAETEAPEPQVSQESVYSDQNDDLSSERAKINAALDEHMDAMDERIRAEAGKNKLYSGSYGIISNNSKDTSFPGAIGWDVEATRKNGRNGPTRIYPGVW